MHHHNELLRKMIYAIALICKLFKAALTHKMAHVCTVRLVLTIHTTKARLFSCAKFTIMPGADGVK